MSTDMDVDRYALESISYLARNDFTDIIVLDHRLIRAKDGNRSVLIWVEIGTPAPVMPPAIRADVVEMAGRENARLDIIRVTPTGPHLRLDHMMNIEVIS